MAVNYAYIKSAGVSLFVHIALLCLALLVAGQVSSSTAPCPPSVEIEIEPSKVIDMGAGKLHFTSGSPPPAPRPVPKLKIRMAAAKPVAPKPTPSEPPRLSAPTTLEEPPPPLPGEVSADSVAVPLPGDKVTEGGGSGTGTGGPPGGGGKGAGGTGTGTGSSSGEGEGNGGDYSGTGFRSGALPGYPQSARRAGREGIVTVRVLVGTDGKPVSVTIRVTSGHEDFDNAALQAVKKWLFSPARRGKEPVASFHDVRIRFRLDEAR
ncbi:MAG: energy transducer TonB [Syntrophorhabdales bacterium]